MNLESAVRQISHGLAEIERLYERPVFNEWAIVGWSGGRPVVLHYDGPRTEDFETKLPGDLRLLRESLQEDRSVAGTFSFAREGVGTLFDAYIVLGEDVVLLCNHTEMDFEAIATDPLWRKAQMPFVDLTEKFGLDPLEMES